MSETLSKRQMEMMNAYCALIDHKEYIARYGQDMPEIRGWTWKGNG